MKTTLRLTSIALVIAVTGCASYRPYSVWNDGGYYDQEVQPNRFRVRFMGNEQTDASTAEDLATLRAAELCIGRRLPFVELSSIHSESLQSGTASRYAPWRPGGAMTPTARNNQYSLPWSVRTVTMDHPTFEKPRYVVPERVSTPVTDLTATCVSESREGVADAAALATQLRALHAKRMP